MREHGMHGGNWTETEAKQVAQDALSAAFGPGDWVIEYKEPYLWLNRELIAQRGVDRDRAEDIAARAAETLEGIYRGYTRHDALQGRLPRTDIGDRVERSFHPDVSGDVLLVSRPGYMPRNTPRGENHAEPYAYDTHVPLLLVGAGIRPGVYTRRVSTLDIAPTLSYLLRVQEPSGNEGRILSEAVATPSHTLQPAPRQ
jgi:hypothetical protein